MELESWCVALQREFVSTMCAYAQERTRTKSHSLCLFKQSQRPWKRRCSPIQHTCPQAYLCWQTHTFWDSPSSQRGLVRCQIGNWQTGKSQIILSQLDRDGLNVKMLLGSPRPPELWTAAKTYSPALCCSAMWGRRGSRDSGDEEHPHVSSPFTAKFNASLQVPAGLTPCQRFYCSWMV